MSELDPARWQALWQRLGGEPPARAFGELCAAYAEPQRHYHSTRHIAACLAHFDTWRALAANPDSVELALWLHDLVYDTRRQDNEAASALRAVAWLKEAGLGQHVQSVERLILATRHQQPPDDADAGLVVDLDLAILAAPSAAYADYERDIRREYAWVPEPLFRAGRATLLEHLLDAPRLYWHPVLRQRWETPARANLRQTLEELRK